MERMQQPQDASDADAKSDAVTSGLPGGGRQVEQEPARGRRVGNDPRPRSDEDLRSELDAMLAGAEEFDPNDVELLVRDGIVVMLGKVPDYESKRTLEELCIAVRGVRELHDQLQVVGETPSQTSDGLRMEAPRAGPRDGES